MNIAYGSIVIYIKLPSTAFKGIIMYWFYGISNPIIADIKGILNVLCDIGIFWGNITPPAIWHWGTVGEMNGYLTPFENWGEHKFVYPVKPAWLAIVYDDIVCESV